MDKLSHHVARTFSLSFLVFGCGFEPVQQSFRATQIDEQWLEYGTRGRLPGDTVCEARHIRTDDLQARQVHGSPVDLVNPAEPVDDPRVGFCGSGTETMLWRLANCERISAGLSPLSCDLRLVEVARAHSLDMVKRGYFSHESPEGTDPFERFEAAGIAYTAAAENIAFYPDAERAHAGWMKSEGHRANILGERYTHLGVGAAPGRKADYLTQAFITRP